MAIIGTSNARKQRNAVVITIPSKFGIEAEKNYIIKEDESLRLIPETEDFFRKIKGLNMSQDLSEFNEKYTP